MASASTATGNYGGTGNGVIINDPGKEIFDFGFANMEFLSVAAGVTAKDKRLKDVKNQAAALKDKELFPKFMGNYHLLF